MTQPQWKLDKYARCIKNPLKGRGGSLSWKVYDNTEAEMFLTLTETKCLVIGLGTHVLESHSLVTARAWMRGISKTDSLLIMYRVLNETRRFRIRFCATASRSGTHECHACVERLSQYFTIQTSGEAKTQQASLESSQSLDELTAAVSKIPRLEGEVTLSKLAAVVSGQMKAELPAAYQHCDVAPESLATMLRLCLSDASFPAFVEQVEKEINSFIKSGNF